MRVKEADVSATSKGEKWWIKVLREIENLDSGFLFSQSINIFGCVSKCSKGLEKDKEHVFL